MNATAYELQDECRKAEKRNTALSKKTKDYERKYKQLLKLSKNLIEHGCIVGDSWDNKEDKISVQLCQVLVREKDWLKLYELMEE